MSHISCASPHIILRIIRKSDGKTMSMNVLETDNRTVKFVKTHLKQLFHPYGRFHLYYKGQKMKSRHHLRHYGITSAERHVEIVLD